MTDNTFEIGEYTDAIPEQLRSVVIASTLNGNTVYTYCPPGTTLEQAIAVYLPLGVKDARELTPEEIAEREGEKG